LKKYDKNTGYLRKTGGEHTPDTVVHQEKSEMKLFGAIVLNILLLVAGCKHERPRMSKIINGELLVGPVNTDSSFDGIVSFYDLTYSRLLAEKNYKEGLPSGRFKLFYANGSTFAQGNYVNGLPHGRIIYFDKYAKELRSENYFNGLKCGPQLDYIAGKLSNYSFYDLEGAKRFDFDYSKLINVPITSYCKNIFYYFLQTRNEFKKSGSLVDKRSLFIYLPNPPGYNFKYYFCFINSKYTLLETLSELNAENIWTVIDLPQSSDRSKKLAIVLELQDPVGGKQKIIKAIE
jgi:hypothetical protein